MSPRRKRQRPRLKPRTDVIEAKDTEKEGDKEVGAEEAK